MKTNERLKVRKSWGDLNPITRIHGEGKVGHKPKYGKADRRSWKRDLD